MIITNILIKTFYKLEAANTISIRYNFRTEQRSSPRASWNSIASDSSGQYLAAVTFDKGVYTSSDYGSKWEESNHPFKRFVGDAIASDSTGQYLAVTTFGDGLWTSSNYGKDWSETSAPRYSWSSIASDSTGQYLAAVAYSKGIWVSSDYGSRWQLSRYCLL